MKFHFKSFLMTLSLGVVYVCARIWAPPIADALHEPFLAALVPLSFLSKKDV